MRLLEKLIIFLSLIISMLSEELGAVYNNNEGNTANNMVAKYAPETPSDEESADPFVKYAGVFGGPEDYSEIEMFKRSRRVKQASNSLALEI